MLAAKPQSVSGYGIWKKQIKKNGNDARATEPMEITETPLKTTYENFHALHEGYACSSVRFVKNYTEFWASMWHGILNFGHICFCLVALRFSKPAFSFLPRIF